ncbi:hypothetical protein [Campylobacter sp. 19-13652]|uniref:hypothetical protein n=1 Tax=Campylobacter sp. 19-13652 TaxID=2840180 RepID=UPI001C77E96A|nr:hypothetical protein [Campylobacter sp. 19-13652]BCX78801.1 hypothetical protein LBC_02630 [Campylobacter sp. 19-13652]
MKIYDTLNHAINASLAKAKNSATSFSDVLESIKPKVEQSTQQTQNSSPYATAEKELKQWNKTMLNYELQSELNKMFFANYGIGDKKQNDPFNQMLRLKELAKKLNEP